MRELLTIISASLRLHWEILRNTEPPVNSAPDSDEVFRAAFDVLTPAQHTITKLILRGHSSLSIAENLGIREAVNDSLWAVLARPTCSYDLTTSGLALILHKVKPSLGNSP